MDGFKKLSGRPRLQQGKRIKKLDARFTEEEFEKVLELEKELGVNKTELIRMRVLYNADKVVLNAKELIRLLDGIGAELGRSGNNINQLARHANTIKLAGALPTSVVFKFNELMQEYILNQQSLQSALRKIIHMMGK